MSKRADELRELVAGYRRHSVAYDDLASSAKEALPDLLAVLDAAEKGLRAADEEADDVELFCAVFALRVAVARFNQEEGA